MLSLDEKNVQVHRFFFSIQSKIPWVELNPTDDGSFGIPWEFGVVVGFFSPNFLFGFLYENDESTLFPIKEVGSMGFSFSFGFKGKVEDFSLG